MRIIYVRCTFIIFPICQDSSHDLLSKDKVFLYVWLENGFKKGLNKIGFADYHTLKNTDLTGIRIIRIFLTDVEGRMKIP